LADFARSPAAALAYLKNLLGPKPQHYVGHNPAGGWAIVLLLALALLCGATGWLGYEDIGGEWLKELHEGLTNSMLVLVLIHLGGVAVGSLAHRENLPRSMVTGRKRGNAIDAIVGAKPFAAAILVAWTAFVAWLLSR
jgi:cytochrome b